MEKKDLILEITRMREIMGINPLKNSTIKTISEDFKTTNGILLLEDDGGKGELGKLILKGLGFGDEVASSVGKQVADEWEGAAKQFADSLKKEGLDDIGKIQQKIRLFKPNLQKVSILVSGRKVSMRLCAKCIKRFKKDGKIPSYSRAALG